MYDFFVEEAARINNGVKNVNEGFWIDAQMKRFSDPRFAKAAQKGRDIIKIHNFLINIDDTIDAVQKLRNSSKTVTQAKGLKNIGAHHTGFTKEELDAKLANLKENKKKIEVIYRSMGGDQTYYAALAANAARDSANAQMYNAYN